MSPVVTVGLPVFNGEKYVRAAISSIREQNLENFEFIISDNGSDDGTQEICRAAARADPRIRYVRSPVNRGGAWNYMRVAREARAPYFMWMAADDIKQADFLASCVAALEQDPGAVLSIPRTRLIDETGHAFEDLNDTDMGMDASTCHERVQGLLRSQASHVLYGVIRTGALRRTRGLLPMVGDDIVLLVELLCRGRLTLVDDHLFFQRRHREQLAAKGHQQVTWHAPDAAVRFTFPQTRLNIELHRAVAACPLGPVETVRTLAQIAPTWVLPRWRGMARDFATALGVPERR